MKIVAVDDERIALESIVSAIRHCEPNAEICGFSSGEALLAHVREREEPIDVAFLDIEMRTTNGLELAERLKRKYPLVNIIFSTGYEEYMNRAFRMHASGYILKPVTREKVRYELSDLRHRPDGTKSRRMRIQTFGNFEVFVDDRPLRFRYRKTKELLAYLVDCRGAMCSLGEISGVLWEDAPPEQHRSYMKNLRADILSTFKEIGCEDVLVRSRGMIGIVPSLVDCDYFNWISGKPGSNDTYHGEYMNQYSWGEITNGSLEMEQQHRKQAMRTADGIRKNRRGSATNV